MDTVPNQYHQSESTSADDGSTLASVLSKANLCGTPATVRFEIYSPGSLDATMQTCDQHAATFPALFDGTPLRAYRVSSPASADTKRCGDGWNFLQRGQMQVHAPAGRNTSHNTPEDMAFCSSEGGPAETEKAGQTLPTLDAPIVAEAFRLGREDEREGLADAVNPRINQAWIDKAVADAEGDPTRAYCYGFVDGLNSQLDGSGPEVQR